jgi:putative ABC transport system permease protein
MNLLRNYLKIAWRYLLRQKAHSLINVVGLSTGFCFSLLISLYVLNELSYDQFHVNKENIYLLPMTWHFNGTEMHTGLNCSAGGPFMKESFPQVLETVRISNSFITFRKDEDVIKESGVYFVDSAFFKIFSFPFLLGNPDKALTEPNSVVVTEDMAIKYFSSNWRSKDLLNKTLVGTNNKLYKITGVIKNVPSNSHIQFNFVASFSSLSASRRETSWDNSEFQTYVLLQPGTNVEQLKKEIPGRIEKRYSKDTRGVVELTLVPLKDIYLNSPIYKVVNTSSIYFVRIFSAIALLIIIIATFNYINLSTARSMERALEVGVRKVMGAFREQLFYQFMGESLLVTGLSLGLAFGMVNVLLPFFNPMTGKILNLQVLVTPWNFSVLVLSCLVISLVAGIYPALILSNYKPVKVLKGKLKDSSAGIRLRKILVIAQFAISISLIICTLTISHQMNYIQNKDLGFDREQMVALSLDSLSRSRIQLLKNKISTLPGVVSSSACLHLPVNITGGSAVNLPGEEERDRKLLNVTGGDSDFLKTVGFTPIAGPGFTRNSELLENPEIILNESALVFFGWTANEAIGKELNTWQKKGVVKGVIKDFHFASLHNSIKPLLILSGKVNNYNAFLLVRTQPGSPAEVISQLRKTWKEITPESPFISTNLNDRYELLYQSENRLGLIIDLFALLAVLISGLGLFGLASYTILQRTKELGVRKILGASMSHILQLVTRDFIGQVLISLLIAAPISYYLMNQWLSQFSYKVEFSWLVVGGAGIMAVLIALITISYHAVQVAKHNPVESLRNTD